MLGQQQVAGASNKLTAVPALLERLALTGCIVPLDARPCQTETGDAIRAQEADYVITIKGNPETLQWEIRQAFAAAHASAFRTLAPEHWDTYHVSAEEGHGRRETRPFWTNDGPDRAGRLPSGWTLARPERDRHGTGEAYGRRQDLDGGALRHHEPRRHGPHFWGGGSYLLGT